MGLTKQGFETAYAMLSSEFRDEVSAMLAETHRQMLLDDGITDAELISGVKKLIRDRKYAKFPRYAEILEAIRGNPDDAAILALDFVKKAISAVGQYQSVKFPDPRIHWVIESLGGWTYLCTLPLDEWKWLEKDFTKLYKASLGKPLKASEYLVGRFDHENMVSGYITQPERICEVSNPTYESAMKSLPGIPKVPALRSGVSGLIGDLAQKVKQ